MSLLYGIIPFFDFSNNSYRKDNLKRFISNYKNQDKLKLILVEAVYENNQLEDYSNEIFLHLKLKIKQKLWYKENLINIAIKKHLPNDWENVCWLDSDVDFLNKNWVNDTLEYLKSFDFVQLFDTAIVLNKKSEVISDKETPIIYKSWLNFSSNFKKNIIGQDKFQKIHRFINLKQEDAPYLKPHTGFGWATKKTFFSKIENLWEYNIIGGADNIIAKCITNNIDQYPFQIFYSEEYKNNLMQYYNKFKGCNYRNIPGSIIHHWHGSYFARYYIERHEILKKYNFSHLDINYNQDILEISNKTELLKELEDYFNGRECF